MGFFSENVLSISVTISMANISMACASKPRRRTKRSETTIAAAAPSLVGQHCNFVKGPKTFGDFKICSNVYSSRNCDFLSNGECC